MDIFESLVFKNLEKKIRQIRHQAFSTESSFENEVANSMLNLNGLRTHDAKAVICQNELGYDVKFSKSHLAFNFIDLMKKDNPDVNMMFTDDLLNFEPNEDLIYKSKVPLWVVCPLEAGKRVVIKRVW